jgi:uncharacterized membrane protein YhaH (DUF805 family)
LIRFLFILLLLSLAAAGVAIVVEHELATEHPSLLFETLALLFISTAVIFRYLHGATATAFVALYFLTIVVKLILYGVYVAWMVWHDGEKAFANVVFFMIVYVCFTSLEIIFLYRKFTSG